MTAETSPIPHPPDDLTPQPPLRRGEGEEVARRLPLSAPERGLGHRSAQKRMFYGHTTQFVARRALGSARRGAVGAFRRLHALVFDRIGTEHMFLGTPMGDGGNPLPSPRRRGAGGEVIPLAPAWALHPGSGVG